MLRLAFIFFQILQTGFERIGPVGDAQTEHRFDFCFIQHRVGRTFHFRGEFVGVAGLDIALRAARQFGDRLREVVPRANPSLE